MMMMHLPLVEGVFLRSEHGFAAAVRRSTGEIVLRKGPWPRDYSSYSVQQPLWVQGWLRAWATWCLWWELWRWALEQTSPDPNQQLASAVVDQPTMPSWHLASAQARSLPSLLHRFLLALVRLSPIRIASLACVCGFVLPWLLAVGLRQGWLHHLPFGSKRYCWLLFGVGLVWPVLLVALASLYRPLYRCLAYQLAMMLVLEQAENMPKALGLVGKVSFTRRWSATMVWYVAQGCALVLSLCTWHGLPRRLGGLILLVAQLSWYVAMGLMALVIALWLRQLAYPIGLQETPWYGRRAVWRWPWRWLWPQPDDKQIGVALAACRALCSERCNQATTLHALPLPPASLADACPTT